VEDGMSSEKCWEECSLKRGATDLLMG